MIGLLTLVVCTTCASVELNYRHEKDPSPDLGGRVYVGDAMAPIGHAGTFWLALSSYQMRRRCARRRTAAVVHNRSKIQDVLNLTRG